MRGTPCLVSSPGGRMSAYGDCLNPLACTSTRRRPCRLPSPPARPRDPARRPGSAKRRRLSPSPAGSTATRQRSALDRLLAGEAERHRRPSGRAPPRRPPCFQASYSAVSSQHPVARSETPRGPVRRSSPRTTSSQEWNTVAAYGPCASSKNVASTGPLPSSRVRNTTRRPDRIGGVWVATLTPATSSSERLRRRQQVARPGDAERRAASARRSRRRGWLTSRPRISSSARTRSAPDISGSPDASAIAGVSPRSRVSWTASTGSTGSAAWDCIAASTPRVVEAAPCRVQVALRVRRKPVPNALAELVETFDPGVVSTSSTTEWAAGGDGDPGPGRGAATRTPPGPPGRWPGSTGRARPPGAAGRAGSRCPGGVPDTGEPMRVERVERTGQHQPLGDRAGRPGTLPQVGQRVEGPGGDDPGHLGVADPLDVGQARAGCRSRARASRRRAGSFAG